jgi:phage tail sheath protein FI
MAERVASQVIIRERPPAIRSLRTAAVSQGFFVGISERGPVGTPTLLTSFAEYLRIFGSYTLNGVLAQSVASFFAEGGEQCYVVRTMHYTDITDASSATGVASNGKLTTPGAATPATITGSQVAPFNIADGDTLIVDVDGGGDATATFNAAAASLTSVNAENYALTDGWDLTVEIDTGLTQTVVFNTADFVSIGAATALEVAAVINTDLIGAFADGSSGSVVITSDKKGTGSAVQVTGGTSNGALGFSTTIVTGTGDFVDASVATVAEVKLIAEAAISGLTVQSGTGGVLELETVSALGTSSTLDVDSSSTTATTFGLTTDTVVTGDDSGSVNAVDVDGKTPGLYGDSVTAEVRDASSGVTGDFTLAVLFDSVVEETWPNLSTDPTAARYYETIVNDENAGSNLIVVTDLDVAGNPRPANQSVTLTGGDDGLTSLDDTDFLGSDVENTGLHAANTIQGAPIFAVPDRITPAVQTGLLTYIEVDRNGFGFAVLSIPEGNTAAEAAEYALTTAGLTDISEYGAVYYPQVKILNPSQAIFGTDAELQMPPDGHIVGAYARTDASRTGGVYEPPAGVEVGRLFTVTSLETEETFELTKRNLLAANLVNPISRQTASAFFLDGVDCLKVDGNFPSVSERRGVIFIESTLADGMEVYRFRTNDARLRGEVKATIEGFLSIQTNLGAFRYSNPAEAFFVEIDPDPQLVFQNRLVVRIQLATAKPAKFIELEFSQDLRGLA